MRRALQAAWVVVALAVVAGLGAYVALGSDTAARVLVKGGQAASGGRLQYAQVRGNLHRGLRLRDVRLQFDGGRLHVAQLDWSPDLRVLWRRHLALGQITLGGVRLELDARADDAAPDPPSLPRLAVPGRITLAGLQVRGLQIVHADSAPLRVDELQLSARLTGSRLHVPRLAASGAGWAANAALQIDFAGDAPLEGEWQGQVQAPSGPPWRLTGHLGGALRRSVQAGISVHTPMQGRLVASIDRPLSGGSWQAHAWVNDQTLTALQPALPPWVLRLDGRAHGRGMDAEVALVYGLQGTPAGSLNGLLDAQGNSGRWQVKAQMQSDRQAGRIDLAGQMELAARVVDVALDWRELRWPPGDPAQVASPTGSARLRGGLADWLLSVDAALQAQGQAGALTARVAGDATSAHVQQFTARALGGSLDGQGLVRWSPVPAYEFDMRATGFDPGLLSAQWPGRVDAVLAVAGHSDQLDLRLSDLAGQLRGQALGGGGALVWRPGSLRLDAVALRMGRARLHADGVFGAGPPLLVDVSVPQAGALLSGARGSLTATLRLQGPDLGRVQLKMAGAGLAYGDFAAQSLDADIDLDRPNDALSLRMNADAVAVGEQRLGLRLRADGRAAAHGVRLQVDGAGRTLALAGQGAVLDDGWQGRLDTGTLSGLPPAAWMLASPLALELRRDRQVVGQHCWQAQDARLCSAASRIGPALRLAAEIDALPLAPLAELITPHVVPDGSLRGQLNLRRDGGPLLGDVSLAIPAGSLHVPAPDGDARRFEHGGARISGRFTADGGDLEARLAGIDGAGELLAATLRLPPLPAAAGSPLPLQGTISAQLPDIGLVEPWLPGVEELAGRFDARLQIAGSMSAPRITGRLAVRDASAALPELGIELRDGVAQLLGEDGQNLRLSASAKSGQGSLSLRGDGRRAADGTLGAQFDLRGEQFQIIDTAALQARVTPTLNLSVAGDRLTVGGGVQVPYARIKAVDQPAAVRRSPDVVVHGRPAPRARTLAAQADVRVVLGDDVRVSAYGFDGSLGGALQVRQRVDGTAAVSGEVRVKDGQYAFYGQRLPVTEGVLRYAGGPPDNPGLRITAARTVGDVTAEVRLRGTAKAPQTQLSSTPPLAQSEILSYLVLGRPLREASGAQGDLLIQAASSVGLRGGSALARRLGQALGFDEATLGSDGSGGANLALGRYLTPRLYIGYGLALAEQTNAITLRYTLSEHWLVEVLSGLTQTADLLYKVER